MKAAIPSNETERLEALREYHILDTAPEAEYDDITALAAHICDVPISMISLVDEARQWFKAKTGLRQNQTARDVSFCAHAILKSNPLIVRDASKDPRFSDSALVTHLPRIRFYAGFPLVAQGGLRLGTLCAIDRKPRELSVEQLRAMRALARQVMALLELRRVSAHLADALEHVKVLQGLLPICAWCKRIRDDSGYWTKVETYLQDHTGADFTHGICPDCLEKTRPKTGPEGEPGSDARVG
jgi:GAF domain-containing protein